MNQSPAPATGNFFARAFAAFFNTTPREKTTEEKANDIWAYHQAFYALDRVFIACDLDKESIKVNSQPFANFNQLAYRAVTLENAGKEISIRHPALNEKLVQYTEQMLDMLPRRQCDPRLENEFERLCDVNPAITGLLPLYPEKFENANGMANTIFFDSVMAKMPAPIAEKEILSASGDYYKGVAFKHGLNYYPMAKRRNTGLLSYMAGKHFADAKSLLKSVDDKELELDKRDVEPFIKNAAQKLKIN